MEGVMKVSIQTGGCASIHFQHFQNGLPAKTDPDSHLPGHQAIATVPSVPGLSWCHRSCQHFPLCNTFD
jgi:hypothetical protein